MKGQKQMCNNCTEKQKLIETRQYYKDKLAKIKEQINTFPSLCSCFCESWQWQWQWHKQWQCQ